MVVIIPSNVDAVNFVARTSKNLGVIGKVKKIPSIEPYEAGLITVALGGSILTSNVQPQPFYTAQNIIVLRPIKDMSFNEKVFYCMCIEKNKDKYAAFGREANRTLKELQIPKTPPEWVDKITSAQYLKIAEPMKNQKLTLGVSKWELFRYDKLFKIERGRGKRKYDLNGGDTPFITATDQNNGFTGFTDIEPFHNANVITVARNGSVGEAFYQPLRFCSTEDVHVFNPLFKMNIYHAFFLIPLIRKEKYRYSFGRKWGINRMKSSLVKLPAKSKDEPDWEFIENYIKSLPYSYPL